MPHTPKPDRAGRGGRGPSGGRDRDPRRDAPARREPPARRSLSGKAPPPRTPGGGQKRRVPKPTLPTERPQLPGGVYRDIRRTTRQDEVDDVAAAVGAAGEAIEDGDLDRAVELLAWASSRAPRSTSIREGLGVAYYLSGQFEEAQRELLAYRRMSGRADQNHLLADSARAVGRTDRVLELVDEMLAAHQAGKVPVDRVVEAVIVQAAIRADGGDYEGALATLDRAPLPAELGTPHGRTWDAAGDIAERLGDTQRAREDFEAVLTVEEDFLDAAERLAALGGSEE